ncbi:MAG: hypothetical protein HFG33_02875 [Bacilli bacterium]|nr:hypothetical protein [Bacilli bacterium]
MKDATGELSTTVIAIVAIAAIAAIFTVFLLPTLTAQIALSQACSSGPGTHITNTNGSKVDCADASGAVGQRSWECTYTPADGGATNTKTCKD